MKVYYNEIDPYCCQWLKNLMAEGHIPEGVVDDRDIRDVSPEDVREFDQCHWFAGIGGWPLALKLAGADGLICWTGSCPCQDFSNAGKRQGIGANRDLWPTWCGLIQKRKPPVVFGEQVAAAPEWYDRACDDMENLGYAIGQAEIAASAVGAWHERLRLWFVGDSEWNKQPRQESCSRKARRVGRVIKPFPWDESWQSALSRLRTVDDGIPRSVAATDAARNAIVPQVAAEFISAYLEARS